MAKLSKELVGVEVVEGFVLEEDSWFEQFGFDMDPEYEETDRQELEKRGIELIGYARNTSLEYSTTLDLDYAIAIIGKDKITDEFHVYFWERHILMLYK